MNVKSSENNIAKLEAQINALQTENSELETNNQLLSKKAEWLETLLLPISYKSRKKDFLNYPKMLY